MLYNGVGSIYLVLFGISSARFVRNKNMDFEFDPNMVDTLEKDLHTIFQTLFWSNRSDATVAMRITRTVFDMARSVYATSTSAENVYDAIVGTLCREIEWGLTYPHVPRVEDSFPFIHPTHQTEILCAIWALKTKLPRDPLMLIVEAIIREHIRSTDDAIVISDPKYVGYDNDVAFNRLKQNQHFPHIQRGIRGVFAVCSHFCGSSVPNGCLWRGDLVRHILSSLTETTTTKTAL